MNVQFSACYWDMQFVYTCLIYFINAVIDLLPSTLSITWWVDTSTLLHACAELKSANFLKSSICA